MIALPTASAAAAAVPVQCFHCRYHRAASADLMAQLRAVPLPPLRGVGVEGAATWPPLPLRCRPSALVPMAPLVRAANC